MKEKIIQHGAEALIILEENIIKRRIKKSYRISEIDEKIRKQRTRSEAKLLEKAHKIIATPKVIDVNEKTKEIVMEFIDGKRISEFLNHFTKKHQLKVCRQIGEEVAKLHNLNIIHGDLTTSNMILKGNEIYFIDFGLGFISHKYEDKAVDLYLLREALEAKHFENWELLIEEVFNGYKNSKDSKIVFERLKMVEKRGRYKH